MDSLTIVAIHGCKDAKTMTFIGGRHQLLKEQIQAALTAAGFPVTAAKRFPGVNPKNICNKNRSSMGAQLEISIAMRRLFFEDITRLRRKRTTPVFLSYVHALDEGIRSYQTEMERVETMQLTHILPKEKWGKHSQGTASALLPGTGV